jgi:Kef-type K+ transport system membrane component KefB
VVALDNQFYEFGLILAIAALVGLMGTALRQPLIVSFIVVGVAVGPAWLDLGADSEELELLAEIGIALLLFVVGLKLDLHVIRTMGRVALITGLGQVIFTSVVGFGIALSLGFSVVASTYIAIALTFSSTIIIVKLLSDKREIDSLHGRIAVGFLIVQDIVVVLTMIAISAFGTGDGGNPAIEAGWVIVKGAGMLVAVAILMRWVIPRVLPVFARSQELLILASIGWAVGLAVTGDALGFSKEVGAFLAGVSLASTHFREAISGRLVSVRDFLLLFFFVNLGASLELEGMSQQVIPAIVLSLFVLIGNPLIVIAMMGAMGYRKRTGFLAGLAVAQISEFSLIFAALGVSVGHIDSDTLGLITLVGLITIGVSTYLIMYSHPIYDRIGNLFSPFERDIPHPEDQAGDMPRTADVILFGLGRYGGGIADALRERGKHILGIDFDPEVIRQWSRHGLPVHYGDAEDPELLHHLPLSRAEWVICTAPTLESNLTLLKTLRYERFAGRIALTAHNESDARILEIHGADLVLRPFAEAAVRAAEELYPSEPVVASQS